MGKRDHNKKNASDCWMEDKLLRFSSMAETDKDVIKKLLKVLVKQEEFIAKLQDLVTESVELSQKYRKKIDKGLQRVSFAKNDKDVEIKKLLELFVKHEEFIDNLNDLVTESVELLQKYRKKIDKGLQRVSSAIEIKKLLKLLVKQKEFIAKLQDLVPESVKLSPKYRKKIDNGLQRVSFTKNDEDVEIKELLKLLVKQKEFIAKLQDLVTESVEQSQKYVKKIVKRLQRDHS